MMKNQKLIDDILVLVKNCGRMMLEADRSDNCIETKEGHANFVTKYDKQNQEVLKKGLMELLPEAVFIGEEDENHEQIKDGISFIVDPIDGTTNFIRDLKASTISVGILKDGLPWIGVIGNPYTNEYFYAEKDHGAFLNGNPIHVSNKPISESIILFGTAPYYLDLQDKTFTYLRFLFSKGLDIRRIGSAALDLCYIASGRAEVFFEMRLSPWDYAAGSLIVTEAGGKITTMENQPISFHQKCSILARGSNIPDNELKIK